MEHLFTHTQCLPVSATGFILIELEGGVDYERDGTLNIYLFSVGEKKRVPVCNKTDLFKEIQYSLVNSQSEMLTEAYEHCVNGFRESDECAAAEMRAS